MNWNIRVLVVALFSAVSLSAATGPIAYWSFDSLKNGNITDVTNHQYSFLNQSFAKIDSGIVGKAFYTPAKPSAFDNEVLGTANVLNPAQFTLSVWIKSDIDLVNSDISVTGGAQVFANTNCCSSGSERGFALQIDKNGRPSLVMGSPDQGLIYDHPWGDNWVGVISDTVLQKNRWYNLVVSYSDTSMSIYVNGKLTNTKQYNGGYLPSTSKNIRIGNTYLEHASWALQQFYGQIDELKIYDYPLSSDTIRAHYEAITKTTIDTSSGHVKINLGMKTSYGQLGDTISIPIYLSNYDTGSITSCQFTLNYDQSVASYLGYTIDSAMIAGSDWLVSANPTSNHTVNFAMGGVTKKILYGDGELIRLKFVLASYISNYFYSDLVISKFFADEHDSTYTSHTNGRIIIGTASTIYGDVSGDGRVTSFDAQKVLDYVVGALVLPNNLVPNFTVAVADVSGNGAISSYDAALIYQNSVGLIRVFPCELFKTLRKTVRSFFLGKKALSPAVLTLSSRALTSTNSVEYTVTGRNLYGYTAGEFALQYQPSLIDINNSEVTSEVRGAIVNTRRDALNNRLKLAVVTKDDIDTDDPITLFKIVVPSTNPSQAVSSITLEKALVNEGSIATNYSSDGLIPTPATDKIINPPTSSWCQNNSHNSVIDVFVPLGKTATIQFFDLTGRNVLTKNIVGASLAVTVNYTVLPKGIYLAKIISGNDRLMQTIVR